MLHKLKPVPRALVILGIVAVIGYGLTMVDFSKLMPKKAAPVTAETVDAPTVTTVKPPSALDVANSAVQAATQAAQPAPAAAPAAPSGLTPATSDAGLDAVLRATKK